MITLKQCSLSLLLVFFTIGCVQQGKKDTSDKEMDNPEKKMSQDNDNDMADISHAVATINPTKDNSAKGMVTFDKKPDGLKVHSEFSGLPEGKHGFHIHLYGDCRAADGTSAGTHFNFEGSSKNPPKDIDRITGNLGVAEAGSEGNATADTLISNATLNGKKSIMGRAVIIHAKKNDPNQPPIGAAGARLGCGVIGHANPDQ